jgi:AcrR family transcriptional regulator
MAQQPTASRPERAVKIDGRRTETRARIHDVALEVFTEHGYERATMQQIADRLQITRPALYFHYRSKQDILASIHRALAYSVDDLIAWARTQPRTRVTRQELLRRLHERMSGPWGTFTTFAQANEAAMRDLSGAAEFAQRMNTIGTLLSPNDTVEGRLKGRLALTALFMANARTEQLGGTPDACRDVALELATRLVR